MEENHVAPGGTEKNANSLESISKTLSNYKEILIAIIFFVGIATTAINYYAPLDRVKKLECALEGHRLLAIHRDQESINTREIIAAQNQERMLADLLILLTNDSDESSEIKKFKQGFRENLVPRIDKIRNEITELMILSATLKNEIISLETKISKKECPNEI